MKRIAILAAFVLAACGQVGDRASDSTTSTQPPVESSTTTTTDDSDEQPTTTTDPQRPDSAMPDELLDAIVADAAERAEVDAADVEILSVTEETFNDSSLGCPEPGEVYTQVITPGYIVIVQAGGAEFDYRAGTQPETFKLCE